LPNVGPYIYDVSISGFTRSSIYIYIYDISSLRVKRLLNVLCFVETKLQHVSDRSVPYVIGRVDGFCV